jgi:hypothetical protein
VSPPDPLTHTLFGVISPTENAGFSTFPQPLLHLLLFHVAFAIE